MAPAQADGADGKKLLEGNFVSGIRAKRNSNADVRCRVCWR